MDEYNKYVKVCLKQARMLKSQRRSGFLAAVHSGADLSGCLRVCACGSTPPRRRRCGTRARSCSTSPAGMRWCCRRGAAWCASTTSSSAPTAAPRPSRSSRAAASASSCRSSTRSTPTCAAPSTRPRRRRSLRSGCRRIDTRTAKITSSTPSRTRARRAWRCTRRCRTARTPRSRWSARLCPRVSRFRC